MDTHPTSLLNRLRRELYAAGVSIAADWEREGLTRQAKIYRLAPAVGQKPIRGHEGPARVLIEEDIYVQH